MRCIFDRNAVAYSGAVCLAKFGRKKSIEAAQTNEVLCQSERTTVFPHLQAQKCRPRHAVSVEIKFPQKLLSVRNAMNGKIGAGAFDLAQQ
jgi:hypothetical protein